MAAVALCAGLIAQPVSAQAPDPAPVGPPPTESDSTTTTVLTDPSATSTADPVDPSAATTTTTVPLRPVLPVPILTAPVVVDPDVTLADGRRPDGVVVAASDALAEVPLTSERFDEAAAARDSIATELSSATDRIIAAQNGIAGLGGGRVAISEMVQRSLVRVAKLTRVRDEAIANAKAMVLRRFTSDDRLEALVPAATASPDDLIEQAHERFIASEVAGDVSARGVTAQRRLDATIERTSQLNQRATGVERRERSLEREIARAVLARDRASGALPAAVREVRLTRSTAVVVESDLPLVALDAYWRAANVLAIERPTCRLEWWMLAGVGRSESNHGRFGGSEPDSGGRVSVAIAGLPLDGTRGTRLIVDSDRGALDGDPFVDRAVGAMQFIPGTWRRWARDGSGDQLADPQNLYDGALAAGVYLCNSGPLDTDEGMRRAFFAYNRSQSYVELVLNRARVYQLLPVPATVIAG